MYKILGADNKEYGPVAAEQVRRWIIERRLHAQSLVQAEGTVGWKPLSIFPEFSATLASAMPPPSMSGGVRPGYVASGGNNSMAVTSLVCGCVGLVCCQVVSIAGLVTGIIALNQIKANPQQEGKGMAIGGIVVSALGILAGIGFGILFALGGALEGFVR